MLRNAFRTRLRRQARRQHREQQAGEATEAPPLAEEVLARTQLHRQIAELMAGLEEPYRSVLLLRFYEGRDSLEIGRMYGVAAGTIRWRVNEGLRRLRERLDEQEGGLQRWRGLLLPLAAEPRPTAPGVAAAVRRGAAGSHHVRIRDGGGGGDRRGLDHRPRLARDPDRPRGRVAGASDHTFQGAVQISAWYSSQTVSMGLADVRAVG